MKRPLFRRLRNSEFMQLLKDTQSIYQKNDPGNATLAPYLKELVSQFPALELAYGKDSASGFTEQIVVLDNRRDNAISGLRLMLNAYLLHQDAAKVQAAKLLLNDLNSYGDIQRASYQSETNSITNFTEGIGKNAALQNATGMLGLTEWTDELSSANLTFNTLYLSRVDEDAQSPVATTDLRRKVTTLYQRFLNKTDAFYEIAEVQHQPLVDQLNALTDKYNLLLAQRAGHNDNDAPDAPPIL